LQIPKILGILKQIVNLSLEEILKEIVNLSLEEIFETIPKILEISVLKKS
jgi:hypothetical protein